MIQPLLMLLNQPGKLRVYKVVTLKYGSPTAGRYLSVVTYKPGAKVEVLNANSDVDETCGAGVNVATLDWCIREYGLSRKENQANHLIIEIECTANDIACIPTASDGKFRLHRGRVRRVVPYEELGLGNEPIVGRI